MKETLKKQKLFFISLIGIVVASLTMTATFAYQTLQVEEKEGSKSGMTINIGKLDVVFTKSNTISLTNIPLLPDYKTADYAEFTIDNTNSTDNVAYSLDLTSLEYSDVLATEDFRYTLVKINEDNSTTLITSGDFSTLTSSSFRILFSSGNYRDLNKGDTEKVRLYLWLKETSENQNYLEYTSFKGTITISSLFANEVAENTLLSGIVYRNAKNNIEETKTTYYETPLTIPGQTVSGESERGLSYTNDDYGISYYYRGNVEDNYVNFAGMCWRIVRIQGDGSVKLILEDQNVSCDDVNYTGDWAYINVPFGYELINTSYVMNYLNSYVTGMADKLLEFQNTYLSDISDKLSSRGWCHDTSAYADSIGTTPLSESEINTYYNTLQPFYYGSIIRINSPSMVCPVETLTKFNDSSDMYVGALTADEIIYAGFNSGASSTAYLLNQFQIDNEYSYRTLSPYYFNISTTDSIYYTYTFIVRYNGRVGYHNASGKEPFIRPAIVLNSNTFVNEGTSGDGTRSNPYVIS